MSSSISNFRVFRLLCSTVALFLCAEIATRLLFFGPDSLIHHDRYSPRLITDLGILRPSEIPGVTYLLKPGLKTYFKGGRFSTNQDGFRSLEFTKQEQKTKVRIAVLGGSIEMGTGVSDEEVYVRRLADFLEKAYPGKVEVMNFGIGGLDQPSIQALHGALVSKWSPDIVIFPVSYTWAKDPAPNISGTRDIFSKHPFSLEQFLDIRRHLSRFSFFYVALHCAAEDLFEDHFSDWKERSEDMSQKSAVAGKKTVTRLELLENFLDRFKGTETILIASNFKRPAQKSLAFYESDKKGMAEWFSKRADVVYLDAFPETDTLITRRERIYLGDNHPNARAHLLYARVLFSRLKPLLEENFTAQGGYRDV